MEEHEGGKLLRHALRSDDGDADIDAILGDLSLLNVAWRQLQRHRRLSIDENLPRFAGCQHFKWLSATRVECFQELANMTFDFRIIGWVDCGIHFIL
jgi:hypothetical protein